MELAYRLAYLMQAEYRLKVQAICSKKQAPRFFVMIPQALAAALDLQAHEEVQWQLLGRSDLRLRLLRPESRAKKSENRREGFSAESTFNNLKIPITNVHCLDVTLICSSAKISKPTGSTTNSAG